MTPLEDLFPAQIRCVFSNQPPENFNLLPEEANAGEKMWPKRLREFAHGRTCARLALARLGFPECAIPVGEHRAPTWPDAIVGSISHSGENAAAVVARKSEFQGLGVDLEVNEPLDLMVNGTLIARGEMVVVDGQFGLRLIDVVSPPERLRKLRLWKQQEIQMHR